MNTEAGWVIVLKCKNQHVFETDPEEVRINVDGHAIMPLPSVCPQCPRAAAPPTVPRPPGGFKVWRAVRHARRQLRNF